MSAYRGFVRIEVKGFYINDEVSLAPAHSVLVDVREEGTGGAAIDWNALINHQIEQIPKSIDGFPLGPLDPMTEEEIKKFEADDE